MLVKEIHFGAFGTITFLVRRAHSPTVCFIFLLPPNPKTIILILFCGIAIFSSKSEFLNFNVSFLSRPYTLPHQFYFSPAGLYIWCVLSSYQVSTYWSLLYQWEPYCFQTGRFTRCLSYCVN